MNLLEVSFTKRFDKNITLDIPNLSNLESLSTKIESLQRQINTLHNKQPTTLPQNPTTTRPQQPTIPKQQQSNTKLLTTDNVKQFFKSNMAASTYAQVLTDKVRANNPQPIQPTQGRSKSRKQQQKTPQGPSQPPSSSKIST
jgi:hypothetical protein